MDFSNKFLLLPELDYLIIKYLDPLRDYKNLISVNKDYKNFIENNKLYQELKEFYNDKCKITEIHHFYHMSDFFFLFFFSFFFFLFFSFFF